MSIEYTIRESQGGAIVCRGYYAANEDEAMADFLKDHPAYQEDDFYASESQWND